MEQLIYQELPVFRSRLSFHPLFKMWEEVAPQEKGHTAAICRSLSQDFASHPGLLDPIDDYEILHRLEPLITEALNTILPISVNFKKQLSAITAPFSNKVIHASSFFRNSLMDDKNNFVLPLDQQVENNITRARINLAYKMILKKFYHIELTGGNSFICAYPDPQQDIHNYFEMCIDTGFVDVLSCMEIPMLPYHFILNCQSVNDFYRFPELRTLLPLEQFIFDGLFIVQIEEVTGRETLNKIAELLEHDNFPENEKMFTEFKNQVGYLLHHEKLELNLTNFYAGERTMAIKHQTSKILKTQISENLFNELTQLTTGRLKESDYYILQQNEDKDDGLIYQALLENGWVTAIFCSINVDGKMAGRLDIFLKDSKINTHKLISILRPLIQLLQSALVRDHEHTLNQVNRLVKDHFTAVHASVEWCFHEAALNYFSQREKGIQPKMAPIVFHDVYPLYAVIDIRNSALEREKAIQKDILLQLTEVEKLLNLAAKLNPISIIDEIQSQLNEHLNTVNSLTFSSSDPAILSFIQLEIPTILKHLMEIVPELSEAISNYFQSIDKNMLLCKFHNQYNESVTEINNQASGFLEKEQVNAQLIFPHYFERFITDGVESNIYIGQSITPSKKFNVLYLKNLRLWQLKTMVLTTLHLQSIKNNLSHQLETTQLILTYHQPISIRFRTEERKFDLDSTYHAKYEMIKKRIEKAHIKNTNERLTKPGTVAIVYTGESEAREYTRYIEFLKKEDLFTGEIEKLELEDLQGLNKVKALRIKIATEKKTDLSIKKSREKINH